MHSSISATGSAPAATVWERYEDLDRWSQWAPQITSVEASTRRLVRGLHGTVVVAGVLRVPFEVLAVDETARTWSWRVRLGLTSLRLEHGVEPADSGSRTWLRIRGPAVVVVLYLPVAFFALHSLVLDR